MKTRDEFQNLCVGKRELLWFVSANAAPKTFDDGEGVGSMVKWAGLVGSEKKNSAEERKKLELRADRGKAVWGALWRENFTCFC